MATSAADLTLEAPAIWPRSPGIPGRTKPVARFSAGLSNSGVFVFADDKRPVRLSRTTRSLSCVGTKLLRNADPEAMQTTRTIATVSLWTTAGLRLSYARKQQAVPCARCSELLGGGKRHLR